MEKEMIMKLLEMLIEGKESKKGKRLIGEYVIVRCHDAGVHAGILVDYEGRTVTIKEARRLWSWKCKKGHTLSGVALYGITKESKIAGQLPEIELLEGCEIIPVSIEAERSIRDAEEHNS